MLSGTFCSAWMNSFYALIYKKWLVEEVVYPFFYNGRRTIPWSQCIIRTNRRMINAIQAYVECPLQMCWYFRHNSITPYICQPANLLRLNSHWSFFTQGEWTQWNIFLIYSWGALMTEFTCLYPCPTIRARNVVEVAVEMVLLSTVATSEIGWSVSMATVESTSTFEFPKKRAPWIYL